MGAKAKVVRKVNKSFTLSPATCEVIKGLSRLTGMDQSAIIDGCIQAVWSAILSGGFRQQPSVIEVLALTGAAGASFYIQGRKEEECE